jgi:HK97 family phage major capsid protein
MSATATVTELGPNMSLDDKRREAKTRLEQASAIELRHTGAGAEPLAGEELAQVKRLLTEVDALHASIQADEERRGLSEKTQQLLDHYSQPVYPRQPAQGLEGKARQADPGTQFLRSVQYLEAKNQGLFNSSLNRLEFAAPLADGTSLLEWKATLAGSTSGGALVATDVRNTIVDILPKLINVLDLIPRNSTDSDAIEYIQQTTRTLNVSFVPEATGSALTGTDGRKPESTLVYQNVTAYVRTAATWLPVTNRMLADAPAMRGIINSELLAGVQEEVSRQVIAGDGTGENLLGILNTPNVQTLAKGALNEVDALFTARTMVRTGSKLAPTAYVMNPVDYQQVRLLRENSASATLGQYLMGPPNTLGVPTVWGLPVVEDENVPADTVVVGNWSRGCAQFDREQSSIRVGLINDQFVRNQQTILAEQRLAFVVWRPTAFVKITGY